MAAVRTFHHHNNHHSHHLLLLSFFLFLSLPLSSASETQSLLKLKQSFTNADKSLASWIPNVSPCSGTWTGVICFNNIVTGLHLSDLNLSGTIDVEALAEIHGLRTLSFVNNSFSGTIPSFNKLGPIKSLLLTQNHFSGPIPQNFFSTLSSLKKLWLSGNKFSGEIPVSLTEPDLLKELHLEGNQFTGRLPNLKQDFRSFDVSHNQLEGPIPESLSKYGVVSFSGNEGLCGKPLDKPCSGGGDDSSSYYSIPTGSGVGGGDGGYGSSWAAKVIVILLLAVIAAVIFLFVKSRRRHDDDFSVVSRNSSSSMDELVQVHVPSFKSSSSFRGGSSSGGVVNRSLSASRSMSSTSGPAGRKESSSSSHGKKGGGGTKGGAVGDLVMVNEGQGVAFGMQDLMKAAAEVLGNGGLGSAYKAAMANGLSVVVKRMRDMNKIGRDVFDAEMRQFGRIKHPNILTPLAYHYRKEEKLFVTEYMPKGSLLYVLHGIILNSHPKLCPYEV